MQLEDCKKPRDRTGDEGLVERIQRRESDWRALFDVLVERHRNAVYARCLGYLRNHADADDAVQETLLRAFRAIDSFKGEAAFRTWLFTIADNQCHSLARRRTRQFNEPELLAALHSAHEDIVEPEDSGGDCRELLHGALGQIAAKGRDVLYLRYFADLSMEEIACTLGVGLSAAKMRLYRAQEQLVGLVGDCRMDHAA